MQIWMPDALATPQRITFQNLRKTLPLQEIVDDAQKTDAAALFKAYAGGGGRHEASVYAGGNSSKAVMALARQLGGGPLG